MSEEVKEPVKPEAEGEKPAGEKSKKKISQMSLAEVERAIEGCQKHMGGLLSGHARALVARKEILTKMK